MKYLLAFILLVPSLLFASDEQELNYKIKNGDWLYTYRDREDTYHFEVGKKFGINEVVYRYADLNGTIENRIKFTTTLYTYHDFQLKARTEYRHFDNKESHWRWRTIVSYNPHLYGNFYLFANWVPRWSIKDEGISFDARDQIGITYKSKDWSATPFIERNAGEGYHLNQVVSGIHWEYSL